MKGGLDTVDADAGWTPLVLSTIAGMSTCLGALIVFCHPVEEIDDENGEDVKLVNALPSRRARGQRNVSPSTMAFSLALAGSVMVTVSVVSIGPECLAASSMPSNAAMADEENTFFIFGITLMPIFSMTFLHRLISFGAGCMLYILLSKFAFPEPDEILSHHLERNNTMDSERTDKSSDDESGRGVELQRPTGSNEKTAGNSSLQRRGVADDDVELHVQPDSSSKPRTIARRPPNERCCRNGPIASCVNSMRVFSKGSDLASAEARRANRVAMLLFFSLLIHNFPEGLAVAASALESDQLGLTVTIGIMIHNIPEGIAIAIPCLKARPDSPWLSFILASVSGLAEPAGAFVSLVLLRGADKRRDADESGQSGGEGSLENVLSFVAGIMITVSLLELLPEARRHVDKTCKKPYWLGIAVGFIVMVVTELGMSV
ncbi:hypothetical protein THAOC_22051 [Thalassiosira oceanica]|uniref:Uncharacterized protein n=1 Tax=Thalassiosira oceanica TaxID=159749 RepID=K0RVK9_THAOC|nr:hypothetical protein THAOC_22051 [Thalassiosira oceanica]|eukprot:EJK57863.1 hypothetical protein THAOC_22051 [Thalassiosira oceanica]